MMNRISGLLLFIVSFPLMSVIALISLCVFRKDVFYCSSRLGFGMQKFTILKFRTLRKWSPERMQIYLSRHPEQQAQWEKNRKLYDDPRCTYWGFFLRHFSLDELPQLVNVIRGEMALVGPRPITGEELRFYGKYSRLLHSVKPGITGLWQISGRNLLSYHRRVAINVYYIRHRSWKLDLWILWKTVGAVLGGKGAF